MAGRRSRRWARDPEWNHAVIIQYYKNVIEIESATYIIRTQVIDIRVGVHAQQSVDGICHRISVLGCHKFASVNIEFVDHLMIVVAAVPYFATNLKQVWSVKDLYASLWFALTHIFITGVWCSRITAEISLTVRLTGFRMQDSKVQNVGSTERHSNDVNLICFPWDGMERIKKTMEKIDNFTA